MIRSFQATITVDESQNGNVSRSDDLQVLLNGLLEDAVPGVRVVFTFEGDPAEEE